MMRYLLLALFAVFLAVPITFTQTWHSVNAIGGSIAFTQRKNLDYYQLLPGFRLETGIERLDSNWCCGGSLSYQPFGFKQQLEFDVPTNAVIVERTAHHYGHLNFYVGIRCEKKWILNLAFGISADRYVQSSITAPAAQLNDTTFYNGYQIAADYIQNWDIAVIGIARFGKKYFNGEWGIQFFGSQGLLKQHYNYTSTTNPWRNSSFAASIYWKKTLHFTKGDET